MIAVRFSTSATFVSVEVVWAAMSDCDGRWLGNYCLVVESSGVKSMGIRHPKRSFARDDLAIGYFSR